MASKTSSTAAIKLQRFILGLFCGLLLFGCMPKTKVGVTDKQTPPAPLPAGKPSVPQTPKPDNAQVLAADQFEGAAPLGLQDFKWWRQNPGQGMVGVLFF